MSRDLTEDIVQQQRQELLLLKAELKKTKKDLVNEKEFSKHLALEVANLEEEVRKLKIFGGYTNPELNTLMSSPKLLKKTIKMRNKDNAVEHSPISDAKKLEFTHKLKAQSSPYIRGVKNPLPTGMYRRPEPRMRNNKKPWGSPQRKKALEIDATMRDFFEFDLGSGYTDSTIISLGSKSEKFAKHLKKELLITPQHKKDRQIFLKSQLQRAKSLVKAFQRLIVILECVGFGKLSEAISCVCRKHDIPGVNESTMVAIVDHIPRIRKPQELVEQEKEYSSLSVAQRRLIDMRKDEEEKMQKERGLKHPEWVVDQYTMVVETLIIDYSADLAEQNMQEIDSLLSESELTIDDINLSEAADLVADLSDDDLELDDINMDELDTEVAQYLKEVESDGELLEL
ncbi:hypothetical protein PCE1_002713 [Barthelona sp. PCE]